MTAVDLPRLLRAAYDRLPGAAGPDGAADLRGLYIDGSEVESLLAHVRDRGQPLVDERRLEACRTRFGLGPAEVGCLLACLAPDLDPAYERIYAFLQDDIGKRRPAIGLLLNLFAGGPEDAARLRAAFHPAAPLFRGGLLTLPGPASEPLLMQAPRSDERVVGHLLGLDQLDVRLVGSVRLVAEPMARPDLDRGLPPAPEAGQPLVLAGPDGAGKLDLASRIACRSGQRILAVDVAALLSGRPCPPADAVRLVFREANLLSAATYWSGAPALWDDARAAEALREVEGQLRQWRVTCLLGAEGRWEPPAMLAGRPLARIDLPRPDRQQRIAAWTEALRDAGISAAPVAAEIPALAAEFRLSAGAIRDAVAVAGALARQDGDGGEVLLRHLCHGARAVSSRRLAAIAQEVAPGAGWDQLVLPPDAVEQLHELCSAVRTRGVVVEEWGFGRRSRGGIGLTALFAGMPGTGKTMAAEVVAGELGLPLFRIDLARVVSKWIGETEKNLEQVFQAAEDSNAILFFDEADALFGRRSEVKDSHDRYANLEISYLLQKMETYDGVAILATNMRQQLDDAFLRRLTFNVTFPLPEEDDRRRIWEAVWPDELPRAADVDLGRMALARLAGGNIKNVVMAAAHLAAAEGRPVSAADLLHGVRREYQKLGKQMTSREVASLFDP